MVVAQARRSQKKAEANAGVGEYRFGKLAKGPNVQGVHQLDQRSEHFGIWPNLGHQQTARACAAGSLPNLPSKQVPLVVTAQYPGAQGYRHTFGKSRGRFFEPKRDQHRNAAGNVRQH